MTTGTKRSETGRKARGRPQLVHSDQVLIVARKMLSERNAASFSVRRLADLLDLAPATLYGRFGTKNELLAQAYLQRLKELRLQFRSHPEASERSLEQLLRLMSEPLSDLRLDFAVRFEIEGGPVHGVRSATWRQLRTAYLGLVHEVHRIVRDAALRQGHDLVGGSVAERLLWSLLSSGTSDRNAQVFGHKNASYFRFMARTIVLALSPEHLGRT